MKPPEPCLGSLIQRRTAKSKAVVVDLNQCKAIAAERADIHGLTVGEFEQWREYLLNQGSEYIRIHPRDQALRFVTHEIELVAKVVDLITVMGVLKKCGLCSVMIFWKKTYDPFLQRFALRRP